MQTNQGQFPESRAAPRANQNNRCTFRLRCVATVCTGSGLVLAASQPTEPAVGTGDLLRIFERPLQDIPLGLHAMLGPSGALRTIKHTCANDPLTCRTCTSRTKDRSSAAQFYRIQHIENRLRVCPWRFLWLVHEYTSPRFQSARRRCVALQLCQTVQREREATRVRGRRTRSRTCWARTEKPAITANLQDVLAGLTASRDEPYVSIQLYLAWS